MKIFYIVLVCFCAIVFNGLTAEEGMMEKFVLVGKMRAKPGCEQLLEDTLRKLAEGTYTEEGCLFYALHRDLKDPSLFVLIEGWASNDALEEHFKAPHFLKQFPVLSTLIVGEPELTYLNPLGSGPKGNLFHHSEICENESR